MAARLLRPPGPLNFEGFATVDILVDEGRIAAIAPAGVADFGGRAAGRHVRAHRAAALRRRAHPYRQGSHLAAQTQSRRRLRERARCGDRRPFGQLERRPTSPRGWSSACARAYAYGTTALRTHIDSVGAQTRISWPVFAEARERWRDRITLQAAPIFSVDFALDRSHMADIEAMLDAHGTGILGAVTYMVPRLREGLDDAVRARRAQRLGARLPCRRKRRSGGALAQGRRRHGDRAPLRAPHSGRPLLLARAAGGRRTAKDDRRRRARGDQRRLAADVQSLPPGSPSRPHAALARRHRPAGTQGGRRQRDDRQRQHPRSVLPLWRSRHDGDLA